MSFRHTYITEYLYKHGKDDELRAIKDTLDELGTVNWHSSSSDNQLGYFHGIIKDLDGSQTKSEYQEIVEKLEKVNCRLKIVFE